MTTSPSQPDLTETLNKLTQRVRNLERRVALPESVFVEGSSCISVVGNGSKTDPFIASFDPACAGGAGLLAAGRAFVHGKSWTSAESSGTSKYMEFDDTVDDFTGMHEDNESFFSFPDPEDADGILFVDTSPEVYAYHIQAQLSMTGVGSTAVPLDLANVQVRWEVWDFAGSSYLGVDTAIQTIRSPGLRASVSGSFTGAIQSSHYLFTSGNFFLRLKITPSFPSSSPDERRAVTFGGGVTWGSFVSVVRMPAVYQS